MTTALYQIPRLAISSFQQHSIQEWDTVTWAVRFTPASSEVISLLQDKEKS